MSRRRSAQKRVVQPDSVYNSVVCAKFINALMGKGKKTVAEKILYGAIDLLNDQKDADYTDGVDALNKAIAAVSPNGIKVTAGWGCDIFCACACVASSFQALGIRWLIAAAIARSEHQMKNKLAQEIDSACKNMGAAFKKREDTRKMAEAIVRFLIFGGDIGGYMGAMMVDMYIKAALLTMLSFYVYAQGLALLFQVIMSVCC